MRRAFVLCVLFAGCFFKPDKPAATGDGGVDGHAGGDGSAAACAHFGDWSGPILIANLTAGSANSLDADPALSPDGTKLVFVRTDEATYAELWMSTVTGTTFGSATKIFGNNSGAPTWDPRGDRLYFLHDFDRSIAMYSGSGFGTPMTTPEFGTLVPTAEGRLSFTGDGKVVYYEVTDGSGETHTYRATGSAGQMWTVDRELTELDTGSASSGAPYDQETPWISTDDLELFFSTSNGNSELRTATRGSAGEPFSTPRPLASQQQDGWRPTVSADGTLMVYCSADGQLYYTTRSCTP